MDSRPGPHRPRIPGISLSFRTRQPAWLRPEPRQHHLPLVAAGLPAPPDPGRGRLTMTATLERRSAALDSQHTGDIRGALGTIRLDDTSGRRGRSAHLKTLLAIVGPGLIVMVG